MLDQVVLRPGELARFPEDQLRILTDVNAVSLLDSQGEKFENIRDEQQPQTVIGQVI